MLNFAVHTKETAPEKSVALLEGAEKAFGFVPNLIGTMAESPAATKGYLTIGQIFDETSFSRTERQVVILAASRYNECHYRMASHEMTFRMRTVASVSRRQRDDGGTALVLATERLLSTQSGHR